MCKDNADRQPLAIPAAGHPPRLPPAGTCPPPTALARVKYPTPCSPMQAASLLPSLAMSGPGGSQPAAEAPQAQAPAPGDGGAVERHVSLSLQLRDGSLAAGLGGLGLGSGLLGSQELAGLLDSTLQHMQTLPREWLSGWSGLHAHCAAQALPCQTNPLLASFPYLLQLQAWAPGAWRWRPCWAAPSGRRC